ncbi:MAG: type II toxin-antitoxin system PemK/MazF family toxin [bacterium]|nr:type II toxin-antitoxin system PemK/MazF family toxin [bacterium]
MRCERGDVVVVNLEPIVGSEQSGKSRPCVVVSPSVLNSKLHGVIVCPITDAPISNNQNWVWFSSLLEKVVWLKIVSLSASKLA